MKAPIPIVKSHKGWHFDTETSITEIITRRIGEKELIAWPAEYGKTEAYNPGEGWSLTSE